MNDIIERVAKAICRTERFPPDCGWQEEEIANFLDEREHWEEYEKEARAAIEAMREPTRAMDEAGRFKCHGVDLGDGSMRRACGGYLGETATQQWQRMIDTALK